MYIHGTPDSQQYGLPLGYHNGLGWVRCVKHEGHPEDISAIGVCFFVFHEMGLEPRKTQKPVVERRVTGQPAQSESQKPLKVSGLDEESNMPFPGVPLRYRSTRMAASMCVVRGSCINRLKMWTE